MAWYECSEFYTFKLGQILDQYQIIVAVMLTLMYIFAYDQAVKWTFSRFELSTISFMDLYFEENVIKSELYACSSKYTSEINQIVLLSITTSTFKSNYFAIFISLKI